MTLLRPATANDLDRLTAMAARFFARTGYAEHLAFDAVTTRNNLSALLDRDDAAVVVAERHGNVIGAAGALMAAPVFSHEPVMQELFWWVEETDRGSAGPRLFAALRRWAGERGAQVMVMAALEGCGGDRVARYYGRAGLVSLERTFIGPV